MGLTTFDSLFDIYGIRPGRGQSLLVCLYSILEATFFVCFRKLARPFSAGFGSVAWSSGGYIFAFFWLFAPQTWVEFIFNRTPS
ncbi:hypothetical protein F5Y04DRAFT_22478 [Hypomontagnella monticulosa]|nr:hypothetical protein F5Y04DRAFT_22478 [Hypomontagnella monticulosa]